MELPINRKQRDGAILRFLFVCLMALLLLIMQVVISLQVYQSGNEDTSSGPTHVQKVQVANLS